VCAADRVRISNSDPRWCRHGCDTIGVDPVRHQGRFSHGAMPMLGAFGMRKLVLLVVIGTLISTVALLGDSYLEELAAPREAAAISYVLATAGLFLVMTRSLGFATLFALAVAIAAATELSHQLLGFCCFRDLVHDLEPWSFGHLYQTAFALVILIPWYG